MSDYVTLRKSTFSESEQVVLRSHEWYVDESEGTMTFRSPIIGLSERKIKQILRAFVKHRSTLPALV